MHKWLFLKALFWHWIKHWISVYLYYYHAQIFLQSDVKSVALQLREDFMEHGNGCICMSHEHEDSSKCDDEGWLVENPYGVSTDWEAHVLGRGKRMYRILLSRL